MALKTTKLEDWRVEKGISYGDLAKSLGSSRQYAYQLCCDGIKGAAMIYRLLALGGGELSVGDLISYKDKVVLKEEGFDIKVGRKPVKKEDFSI